MRKKINYQKNKPKNNKQPHSNTLSIPSPAILESYEEISPGFSKKLLELIEKEQNINKDLQQQSIQNNKSVRITAHISALIFSIFLLFLSLFMIIFTNSFIGPVIVICSWLAFLLLMNVGLKK